MPGFPCIGQYVCYNESLAQLLPGGSHLFQLTLWVPDRNLPYLKVGAPVGIRYDACDGEADHLIC
ncbi:hypothetical protein [Candidatus Pantoea multigeneris]|uniref:hypothetical protein n=1 Tax=Candidatus Pantoea multigeneris TaxID=2608357 RepID=UPI00142065CD|nr:hypothetical protein [Pantoea multigeneris]